LLIVVRVQRRTGSVLARMASASFLEVTCASSIAFMASRYAWNSGETLPTPGAMSTTARRGNRSQRRA